MAYSTFDNQVIDNFQQAFNNVLSSSVNRYRKVLEYQDNLSAVSFEIKEIASSANRPLADILSEALPYCQKVEEIHRINKERDQDPSVITPKQSFAILDLTLDILEEYWDILSWSEQQKIREQLEPGTLRANTGSTNLWADTKFAFKIFQMYFGLPVKKEIIQQNIQVLSNELSENRNTPNIYFYLACRGLYIAENIILNEKVHLPFRRFFNSYTSVRLDKFVESLESEKLIKPIVNHYFGSMTPREVVSKYNLQSIDHLYAVLAFYYSNKQEIDRKEEAKNTRDIETTLEGLDELFNSWYEEYGEEELYESALFVEEKFGL